MLTLQAFLENAPKKYLLQLYQSQFRDSSLMQGSKILEKIGQWALDPARIQNTVNNCQPEQKQLLKFIYLAGKRGISEPELNRIFPGDGLQQIQRHCESMESALLVYRRKSAGISYHGFSECLKTIASNLFPENRETDMPAGAWIGYQYFLPAHLMHFFSQILLAQIKITQKENLHRKCLQSLTGQFQYGASLSSEVPEREANLIFQFFAENRYLLTEEGEVLASQKGRKVMLNSQCNPLIIFHQWWLKRRMLGSGEIIGLLSRYCGQAIDIRMLSRSLAVYSMLPGHNPGNRFLQSTNGMTWEQLPAAVQELWLQGLLEFLYHRGKIRFARFVPIGKTTDYEIMAAAPEKSHLVGLPNFECLLPPDTQPYLRLLVELLTEKISDENMARYRFSKESVIRGFQAGIQFDEFRELLDQLTFDKGSQATLTDWAMCYNASAFQDVLLLKLNDANRFAELDSIPQFIALTRERIPGYGFILPKRNKEPVRELLARFGLFPADVRKEVQGESLKIPLEHPPLPNSENMVGGEIIYTRQETANDHLDALSGKYFKPAREQDIKDKMRIVDFAIIRDKNLELSFIKTARTRILVRPLHLIKNENPVRLIAIDIKTGYRNEYPLSEVTSVHALE